MIKGFNFLPFNRLCAKFSSFARQSSRFWKYSHTGDFNVVNQTQLNTYYKEKLLFNHLLVRRTKKRIWIKFVLHLFFFGQCSDFFLDYIDEGFDKGFQFHSTVRAALGYSRPKLCVLLREKERALVKKKTRNFGLHSARNTISLTIIVKCSKNLKKTFKMKMILLLWKVKVTANSNIKISFNSVFVKLKENLCKMRRKKNCVMSGVFPNRTQCLHSFCNQASFFSYSSQVKLREYSLNGNYIRKITLTWAFVVVFYDAYHMYRN